MALSRGRRYEAVNYWPGFVDALSTMLLVIIFLLSVFMLAQFFLSQEVSGKDKALAKLNRQVEELTNLLALERTQKSVDESKISALAATLDSAERQQKRLQDAASRGAVSADAASGKASAAATALDQQKEISAQALAQVDVLNQQIAALRKQLGAIEDALSVSEAANKESQSKISDLGQRLNVALAQKVQELNRYRSDFFGRLRQILGSRPDIRVVGDRFVFQSSVLFDVGKADISEAGRQSLDTLAAAVIDLEREIPPDIPWILRVDGHTDNTPITGPGPYKSNWELSTARAVAVVQYLISKGVEPDRLAAAGFGQFDPIDPGNDEEARARNRRIELKLTER
jgi:chemotaxis protein MotB